MNRPLLVLLIAIVANLLVAQSPPPAPAIVIHTLVPVRNEVPAPGGFAPNPGWTLQHLPVAGVTCWRNGLHQTFGVQFVLTLTFITSPVWKPTDVLACDYEYSN